MVQDLLFMCVQGQELQQLSIFLKEISLHLISFSILGLAAEALPEPKVVCIDSPEQRSTGINITSYVSFSVRANH